MKKRIETRDAHAVCGRLHVFEKSGETSDDFARVQLFGDSIKFLQRNSGFLARVLPTATDEFLPA